MSNIILLFYTVICCIDYCFAVGIHRLEGEDGRWRKRTRGWGSGGRSNRNGVKCTVLDTACLII